MMSGKRPRRSRLKFRTISGMGMTNFAFSRLYKLVRETWAKPAFFLYTYNPPLTSPRLASEEPVDDESRGH